MKIHELLTEGKKRKRRKSVKSFAYSTKHSKQGPFYGGYYGGWVAFPVGDNSSGEGDGGGVGEGVEDNRYKGKIVISTDPEWYGGTDYGWKPKHPAFEIPLSKLTMFEPESKMREAKSAANWKKIALALKKGESVPPIYVRKTKDGYQVMDGHHRFWAHKMLKRPVIKAYLVPEKDIIEQGSEK